MTIEEKEQCEVCRKWFHPWELTVLEEGVWVLTCCEKCSKGAYFYEQINTTEENIREVQL